MKSEAKLQHFTIHSDKKVKKKTDTDITNYILGFYLIVKNVKGFYSQWIKRCIVLSLMDFARLSGEIVYPLE